MKTNPIRNVTVIGAGVMGTGVAQRMALAGYSTCLYDISSQAVERALREMRDGPWGVMAAVRRGLYEAGTAEEALGRIRVAADLAEACAAADLVVECVFEDLGVKIRLFRELDRLCPAHTLLASNTSGFSIDALAAATNRSAQVVGWHFASPVPVMKLSEIVVHAETSEEVRQVFVDLAQRVGVNPEVINDDPFHWGFVVNRMLMAILREAKQIVADGVAKPDQVDRLLKDCFRWPYGPFEMQQGMESHHYYAGTDAEDPPASMSAAYQDAARFRRRNGGAPAGTQQAK